MCFFIAPQEKMTIKFSVRIKKEKLCRKSNPSGVKQCKMLQDVEQRVGVEDSGLDFRIPVSGTVQALGAKAKEIPFSIKLGYLMNNI